MKSRKGSFSDDTSWTTENELHLRVGDVPGIPSIMLFGFQQTMLVLSGMLVLPFIVAEMACAGDKTTELRVKLIAAAFVTCGIATLVQTSLGLRLSILHGPSFAFLPALVAYKAMPENECHYTENDPVPEIEWKTRLQTIEGSLMLGVLPMIFLGATGLVGKFAKCIGPITICPLMILLTLGNMDTLTEKMETHWMSIVELVILLILVIFLEDVEVPIPYYSFEKRKCTVGKARIFGQFPYLIGIGIVWTICGILTVTNAISPESPIRLDKNVNVAVLEHSPWVHLPLPFEFGAPKISVGLLLGFMASATACIMESIGDYNMAAKISCEPKPPSSSVNRAILCEGFGALLAGMMGIGVGVTTYAENIALMKITKVASRITMQVAGVLLILFGLFTKFAALLATIPEAIIGGVLGGGMCMICGVAFSNLHTVDLRISRNLTIMGTAIVIGCLVPSHFSTHPVHTGTKEIDDMLNMLLTIKMLIGGMLAFILDNIVPGATPAQRGFEILEDDGSEGPLKAYDDGYALPEFLNRLFLRFPFLTKLPFLPSYERLLTRCSSPTPSEDDIV